METEVSGVLCPAHLPPLCGQVPSATQKHQKLRFSCHLLTRAPNSPLQTSFRLHLASHHSLIPDYLCLSSGWRWALHPPGRSAGSGAEGDPLHPQLPLCKPVQPGEHLPLRAWWRCWQQLGQWILAGEFLEVTLFKPSFHLCKVSYNTASPFRAKKSRRTFLTSLTGRQMAATVWRQVCRFSAYQPSPGLGAAGWNFKKWFKSNVRWRWRDVFQSILPSKPYSRATQSLSLEKHL